MKNSIKNVLYPGMILTLIFCVIGFLGWAIITSIQGARGGGAEQEQSFGGQQGPARDVFGTLTATVTAPLTFYTDNNVSAIVTSTAVLKLLQGTDEAMITIAMLDASSTNYLYWDVAGSNDGSCDTASSTTGEDDVVLIDQVHWFQFDEGLITNRATTTDVLAGSSNATGTYVLLENVIWDCLKFGAKGASTTLWMQIKEKILTTP